MLQIRNSLPNESINDLQLSAEKQQSYDILANHITTYWKKNSAKEINSLTINKLLRRVHLLILNFDDGGKDEEISKDRLNEVLLGNPLNVDSAWNNLIQIFRELSKTHGGVDRKTLQVKLGKLGFETSISEDYEEDIEKLQQLSERMVEKLRDLSVIRLNSREIKINRESSNALNGAIEHCDRLLVIGDPGSGKSGALHDLAQTLVSEGRDVVCLGVDRIAASSMGMLRQEMGLAHDLMVILENWQGKNEDAYLIIDGLDSARGFSSGRVFQEIISSALKSDSRWKVIASIRKFDLRNNPGLQTLFKGNPPSNFIDNEFKGVVHVNIPQLSKQESAQLFEQAPEIEGMISNLSPEFVELLGNLFNLRLAVELISMGESYRDLNETPTQIGLLERYWDYKVLSEGNQISKERIIRNIVEEMIDLRELKCNKLNAVPSMTNDEDLSQLIKDGVLSFWVPPNSNRPNDQIITFSHNIIFDYAVARIKFQGSEENRNLQYLEEKSDLFLVLRPSIVFYLQYLWYQNRRHCYFWKMVYGLFFSNKIREIGKIVGPEVAVDLAENLEDFDYLFEKIDKSNDKTIDVSPRIIQHVVGAFVTNLLIEKQKQFDFDLWTAIAERFSNYLKNKSIRYSLRTLLTSIVDEVPQLSKAQKASLGKASRALIKFLWSEEYDWHLAIHTIKVVCKTFGSNPEASSKLLRRMIEKERIKEYGHRELPRLANHINEITPFDSRFVRDAYIALFDYEEPRDEPVPYGGQIISMVSNKKQEIASSKWRLSRYYERFIQEAPKDALIALIRIVEDYVGKKENYQERKLLKFTFNSREASYLPDNSCMWMAGEAFDDVQKMVTAFRHFLFRVLQEGEKNEIPDYIIALIVRKNKSAIFWRILLEAGCQFPETFGLKILPLAYAKPILFQYDTRYEVGEFIKRIYPYVEGSERKKIEEAILNITELPEEVYGKAISESSRITLLCCLPESLIYTDQAKEAVQDLKESGKKHDNSPPFTTGFEWEGYSEDDYHIRQGIPINEEPNVTIIGLYKKVEQFCNLDKALQQKPQQISEIFLDLQKLFASLSQNSDEAHQEIRHNGWGYLAKGCAKIVEIEKFECGTEEESFLRDVLLNCADYELPAYDPQQEKEFEEIQSWSGPSARIEAAGGIIELAKSKECYDNEIKKAIIDLSKDLVSSVRFHIAIRLNALVLTDPELMWKLIENISRNEENAGVIKGLVNYPFYRLVRNYPVQVINCLLVIFERSSTLNQSQFIQEACLAILLKVYIWQGNEDAKEIITRKICDIENNSAIVGFIAVNLRDSLLLGQRNNIDGTSTVVSQRTLELFTLIVSNLMRQIRSKKDQIWSDWNLLDEEEQVLLKGLFQVADRVTMSLFFASGAHAESKIEDPKEEALSYQEKCWFLENIGPMLMDLSELQIPSIIHRIVEIFVVMIPVCPSEVFINLSSVVKNGEEGFYQYETLAVNLVVKIVERYIAEYRHLFKDNHYCREALLDLLDIFVKAGWPSARRITYSLEEIYR